MDSYELEPRGAFLCTVPVVPKRTRTQPAPPPSPDRRLAYALLPLRLFLGVTFVYAGLQKIADPGFLHPGSATYIGSQLTGFAAHSPIGFLITALALPAPQLAGIGVIVAELVIGIATVLGIYTRWDAEPESAGGPGERGAHADRHEDRHGRRPQGPGFPALQRSGRRRPCARGSAGRWQRRRVRRRVHSRRMPGELRRGPEALRVSVPRRDV